eukprot:Amastigsp_a2913_27.p1 type:complete len:288 gc:universal Amastigsp_a2913_27:873-10(-)
MSYDGWDLEERGRSSRSRSMTKYASDELLRAARSAHGAASSAETEDPPSAFEKTLSPREVTASRPRRRGRYLTERSEPATGVTSYARALNTFRAREPFQLSFKKGDVLLILQRRGNWWFAEKNGARGRIPAGYVQFLDREETGLGDPAPSTDENEDETSTVVDAETQLDAVIRDLDRTKEQLLVAQQESIAKSKIIHRLTRELAEASKEIALLKEHDRQATRLASERLAQCLAGSCVISAMETTRAAVTARSAKRRQLGLGHGTGSAVSLGAAAQPASAGPPQPAAK